jgi:hypothetical protein
VKHGSERTLDRVGALAGVMFVLVFVGLITSAPGLPAPEHTISQISDSARENRTGILVGVYLSVVLTGALLVFGAVVVARIWSADCGATGWWIVALAGLAVAAVPNDSIVRFVRAVQHGASGEAIWIGYPASPDGAFMAIPLAVFLLGIGGAGAVGALPRWRSRAALGLAALFAVGAAGVAFDEFGGPLGPVLFLGYIGFFVWIISVSVALWRNPRPERAAEGLVSL